MKELKIDYCEVLHREPEYRVWDVIGTSKKHSKRLILAANIAVICGILGGIGLIMVISASLL